MSRSIVLSLFFLLWLQPAQAQSIYAKENLVAWCIVPFDNQNRTPEQRLDMLSRLGLKKYAYDWREKHLPEMAEEWRLAKQKNIKVHAVWCWIDGRTDQPGALSKGNETIFNNLKETKLKTQIWVGVNNNYFEGLDDPGKLAKGVDLVKYLYQRAKKIGCTIALYNHGDWFGEPENEVRIIEASGLKNVGIIYNFHHAHDQLARYEQIIRRALPYLWGVNLNGMKLHADKIMPLGTGDREYDMMVNLKNAGYRGPIGILGHVENADVEVILKANLAGLQNLLTKMQDQPALKTYE